MRRRKQIDGGCHDDPALLHDFQTEEWRPRGVHEPGNLVTQSKILVLEAQRLVVVADPEAPASDLEELGVENERGLDRHGCLVFASAVSSDVAGRLSLARMENDLEAIVRARRLHGAELFAQLKILVRRDAIDIVGLSSDGNTTKAEPNE